MRYGVSLQMQEIMDPELAQMRKNCLMRKHWKKNCSMRRSYLKTMSSR
jgi:hypothetical protein